MFQPLHSAQGFAGNCRVECPKVPPTTRSKLLVRRQSRLLWANSTGYAPVKARRTGKLCCFYPQSTWTHSSKRCRSMPEFGEIRSKAIACQKNFPDGTPASSRFCFPNIPSGKNPLSTDEPESSSDDSRSEHFPVSVRSLAIKPAPPPNQCRPGSCRRYELIECHTCNSPFSNDGFQEQEKRPGAHLAKPTTGSTQCYLAERSFCQRSVQDHTKGMKYQRICSDPDRARYHKADGGAVSHRPS